METHNFGSDVAHNGMDAQIPFHLVLVQEHTKYELIILTYRIAVIVTGIVLVVIGYLLFANLVANGGNSQPFTANLDKLAPGTVFAIVGLLFCISGITRFMPLPEFDDSVQPRNGRTTVDGEVPTLSPLNAPQFNGKLWENNIRPIIEKVANFENLTRSDRELLKNWLESL